MDNTLANKYRPTTFDEVIGQPITTKILSTQIANKSYNHAILFVGNAGCGKTTCAKIFASQINGEVFTLDCASYNGVADIRQIIENAKTPSLIYDYKVFILDECHTLSSAAWPALLITLEENIPHSIFIFCTTRMDKIPDTIISRVQRFNIVPISENIIEDRLKFVCKEENINISDEAIKIISKSAKGGMRQALTNLEKCVIYNDLSIQGISEVLNIISDDIFKQLYNSIKSKDMNRIIDTIESIYNAGYELHLVIRQFLDYLLENKLDVSIVDTTLTVLQDIKFDNNPKNLIIARYICIK